jgi:hypothetical protein
MAIIKNEDSYFIKNYYLPSITRELIQTGKSNKQVAHEYGLNEEDIVEVLEHYNNPDNRLYWNIYETILDVNMNILNFNKEPLEALKRIHFLFNAMDELYYKITNENNKYIDILKEDNYECGEILIKEMLADFEDALDHNELYLDHIRKVNKRIINKYYPEYFKERGR